MTVKPMTIVQYLSQEKVTKISIKVITGDTFVNCDIIDIFNNGLLIQDNQANIKRFVFENTISYIDFV